MQKIIDSIKSTMDKDLPIVVAQYQRAEFGHGTEERLHWAIICLKSIHDQEGPCFQAFDRRYSDGRENPVQWELNVRDIKLYKTQRCLGAVQVGTVKASELDELIALVKAHPPRPVDPANYRCQWWTMEIIHLFREKGWVTVDIPSREALWPAMKRASEATQKERQNRKKARPIIVQFAESRESGYVHSCLSQKDVDIDNDHKHA